MRSSKQRFMLLLGALCFMLFCVVAPLVHAQDSIQSPLKVTPASVAGYTYSNLKYHVLPANTLAGKNALAARNFGTALPTAKPKTQTQTNAPLATVPAPGFYPSDLSYFGGPVVTNLLSHSVFLNAGSCGGIPGCWGNPEQFLKDLGNSTFIHVTDQYTGTSGTYGVGKHVFASLNLFTNVVSESELFGMVHDAAVALGTPSGYNDEFHVFLPPGIDTCFDLSNVCYSPDNPPSFVFCAYHGSLQFSDIGHVLFSVEPYQNVPGCQSATPDPNGIKLDSQDSILSHELIETITDPDINAWIADSSLIAAGAEIGDLCEPVGNGMGQFLDSIVVLNGHKYKIQLEYSNAFHACSPQ